MPPDGAAFFTIESYIDALETDLTAHGVGIARNHICRFDATVDSGMSEVTSESYPM